MPLRESECYAGKKVGHLTLISRQHVYSETYGWRWEWLCQCDCGRYRKVYTFRLGWKTHYGKRLASVIDCGNHTHEKLVANGHKGVKSPDEVTDSNNRSPFRRLYVKWEDMHRRCENTEVSNYHNYGGRGIKVCDEWQDYEPFKKWALEQGYDPSNKNRNEQTIDRIDVNGNYEPSNCRFADIYVQSNNRTDNHLITIDGVTKTLMEWSREYGISYPTLKSRTDRGITGRDLLAPADKKMNPKNAQVITVNGETYTFLQLSREVGISTTTLRKRYNQGKRDDELIRVTKRCKPRHKKKEVK